MNLNWWLERASIEYPDKTAIVNASGESITYAALQALVGRIGNVLRDDMGVEPDDVVVSCMEDTFFHVAVMYATMRVGAIFSGLNHKQLHEKFHSDIARCQPKVAIIQPDFAEIADLIGGYPEIKIAMTHGTHANYLCLEALASEKSDFLRIEPRSRDDIAAINFTSGTSGVSKGVIFTHGKLETSCWGSIFIAGVNSNSRNLSLVGMFHSGGIADSVRMAMAGGTLYWSEGWDVDRVVRIIREHKINIMYYIIPTMLRDLIRHPDWDALDIEGLRTHVSGEPVSPKIQEALRAKGALVGGMYGMTETMPVRALSSTLYYRDEDELPEGSAGRPNKEFCELVLKDPQTGKLLTGGDVEGEICVRGDVVTPGYYRDAERTAQAFDAEGYLHTRDVGYRDEAGWYFIRGRTDDIINCGAEKLSLLEIDELLIKHPSVRDGATSSVEHERFGEVPAAFVVLAEPMDEDEATRLIDDFFIANLERWKRPRLYVFTDIVPRTAAKQSKNQVAMKATLQGVRVMNADGVTSLSRITAGRQADPGA